MLAVSYALSVTGENRQHLLALAFVLQLRRDFIFTLPVPFLSKHGSFGGSNRGGGGTLALYDTELGNGAMPVKVVEVIYSCPDEIKEMYFLGNRVYEMGELSRLLETYMDGYTKVEIVYGATGVHFPRDIVEIDEKERKPLLEELYGALEELCGQ